MSRLIIFFIFCISTQLLSQQVSGIVTDEDQKPLSAVLVFNMNTEQKTYTNQNGEFSIAAHVNEELRFVKTGFERNSKNVNSNDFYSPLRVIIVRRFQEIEEVEIAYQPTGDLVKDAKNYGDSKLVAKMKLETTDYIHSESSPEVLAPKPGEFVQPVGKGFTMGGPNSQWDDILFMDFLIKNIDKDFFNTELELMDSEIQPFVFYVFKNFERREILFKGVCSQFDLSRFINESYKKIEPYRKNLPNEPPKKGKRKK